MAIRLLLVDDHAVVRVGLRMLLETEADIEIVGEAENAQQALDSLPVTRPNVVLMDIGLPDLSGIEATRRVKQIAPDTAVIALTIHEDEEYFFQMLDAGANGYVPKRAAPDELLTAIRAVAEGQVYLYPSLAKYLVRDYLSMDRSSHTAGDQDGLTDRESEVLALVADGDSNQQIAEALSISPKTVSRHRENIMAKLNLHSRSDLVKYAIRKGIIKA